MRKLYIALFSGALALAGTAAYAASSKVHHMTLRLADGSVANIEYTGDVAPKVSVAAPRSLASFAPQFGMMPFGGFQTIAAMMNAQMRGMQQQINGMMAMPLGANAPIEAAFGKMPAGSHFCAQSMSITMGANGKQNVVRHSAGDCGGANAAVAHDAPAPAHHGSPI